MTFQIQGLPAARLETLIQTGKAKPQSLEETLDEFITNIAEGIFAVENCDIEYIAACVYRVFKREQITENDFIFLNKLLDASSIHARLNKEYPDILVPVTEYVSALVT